MEYVKLGNSEIEVSKLCFGCMSFGNASNDPDKWTLNYEQSKELVQCALDCGINFFDTANQYSDGLSEVFLGRALRELTDRSSVVIASKVYFNEGKLSRTAIHRELKGTLQRLGTDYLDLYIIHRFDYSTPIEETMEALHDLVVSGKVRAIGASAMYGYQFNNMQEVAIKNGWTPFVSMQNHYNLLYREDERELIPVCKQWNVALTPYSPLAAGRLSRSTWHTDTKRSKLDTIAVRKYDSTEAGDSRIVELVDAYSKKYQCTMTQIALAWLYAKGVSAPVIGPTKTAYIKDAAGSLAVKLDVEDIKTLEKAYSAHNISGAVLPPE